MKMKTKLFFILTLLIISNVYLPTSIAQDYATWGLPEGAKMRLGKGLRITDIAYSPDRLRLAVVNNIGIWLYDTQTGKVLDLLTEHTGVVKGVAFSPDSKTLASGGDTLRLWDANDGTLGCDTAHLCDRWQFSKNVVLRTSSSRYIS